MTDAPGRVGGIDSHKDTIHVAAITDLGQHVEDKEFQTTQSGCRRAAAWLIGHGPLTAVGWREPAATDAASPPNSPPLECGTQLRLTAGDNPGPVAQLGLVRGSCAGPRLAPSPPDAPIVTGSPAEATERPTPSCTAS